MPLEYPAKFPYEVREGERIMGYKRTCAHCSSSVDYPKNHFVYLNDRFLCTLTDHARKQPNLCNLKCAHEFFWREFCIRRLNGNFQ